MQPATSPWGFLIGALAVLVALTEWMNRNFPVSLWGWWKRHGIGPLRLLGRCVDFARALGYCLGDVIPAACRRGRERWPEYIDAVRRSR